MSEQPRLESDNLKDYLSSIEEIIDDARNGRMFILVDDEDRENEGDLVIPAQMATPDAINFMATHGRGLICLALTEQRVIELGLPAMSSNNNMRHQTAFTISIEAIDRPWANPIERAASAVLTFARTETFIPMYPATPDKIAPIRKPIAADQSNNKPKISPITTPAIAMAEYWRFRYALAPS